MASAPRSRRRNNRHGHDRSSRRTWIAGKPTHVLSSGVAGTMMANHSGLQWGTMRNLLMAWVLTLPAAMTLSGFLFFAFRQFIFRG